MIYTPHGQWHPSNAYTSDAHSYPRSQGYQWTLVSTHPTRGRTFRRPLNADKFSFSWDRRFDGTADNVQYVAFQHLCSDEGAGSSSDLFSEAHVVRPGRLSTKSGGITCRASAPRSVPVGVITATTH